MTKPNFPDAAAAYTPSEDTAPSWDDMRQGGCMLIDDSLQKLAVYAGGGGSVVLMEEEYDSQLRFVVIDHDKVPALVAALTKAQAAAAEIWAAVEKEIGAYEAAGTDAASGEVGSHR